MNLRYSFKFVSHATRTLPASSLMRRRLAFALCALLAQAFRHSPPSHLYGSACGRWRTVSYSTAAAVASRTARAWASLELATNNPRGAHQVLLIDGDNVRGKSGWVWSAACLAAEVAAMTAEAQLRSVLFLDHGEVREAFTPAGSDGGRFALAFAGPKATADDAIVDAAEWFLSSTDTFLAVATSDFGLRARLTALGAKTKRATGQSRLRYIHSHRIIEVLAARRKQGLSDRPPDYIASFDASYARLASHVNSKARRRRHRIAQVHSHSPSFIATERTWMRVILAERLRLVANGNEPTGLLADFATTHCVHDDTPYGVLSHPIAEKSQKRDLITFADSLRAKPSESHQSHANNPPQIPERVQLRPPAKRLRRRRARRSRRVLAFSEDISHIQCKSLMEHNFDDLEAAINDWLHASHDSVA